MSSLKRVLHVLHDTTVHITCGTVSKTEKERNGQNRTNITKYVEEKLILFLKKKKRIEYIQRYIWHFGILMFTHWLSTFDHYVLPVEIFFTASLRQKLVHLELPMRVRQKLLIFARELAVLADAFSCTYYSSWCTYTRIYLCFLRRYHFPRDPSIEIWMVKSVFTLLDPT